MNLQAMTTQKLKTYFRSVAATLALAMVPQMASAQTPILPSNDPAKNLQYVNEIASRVEQANQQLYFIELIGISGVKRNVEFWNRFAEVWDNNALNTSPIVAGRFCEIAFEYVERAKAELANSQKVLADINKIQQDLDTSLRPYVFVQNFTAASRLIIKLKNEKLNATRAKLTEFKPTIYQPKCKLQ